MNVLAVGCHPDDLEIACGGTLTKYVKEGAQVTMCHVASGSLGHAVIQPEELVGIRRKEAQAAGRVLGVKEVVSLGIADTEVTRYDDVNAVNALLEVVRHARPDVIITHSYNDYMRDHIETGRMAFDASFCSSLVHRATASPFYSEIVPIFFMDNLAGLDFNPDVYVDISEHIDVKIEALEQHASQIKWMRDHDNIDFAEFVRTCSRFRGLQCSVQYAEGFKPCKAWPRMSTKRLLP